MLLFRAARIRTPDERFDFLLRIGLSFGSHCRFFRKLLDVSNQKLFFMAQRPRRWKLTQLRLDCLGSRLCPWWRKPSMGHLRCEPAGLLRLHQFRQSRRSCDRRPLRDDRWGWPTRPPTQHYSDYDDHCDRRHSPLPPYPVGDFPMLGAQVGQNSPFQPGSRLNRRVLHQRQVEHTVEFVGLREARAFVSVGHKIQPLPAPLSS
jgi:hypothetical protein